MATMILDVVNLRCTGATALVLVLLSSGWPDAAAGSEPVRLQPSASLAPGPARENSGIVASRRHDDVFWMINDSGDEPRVYPVRADGTVHGASRSASGSGAVAGSYTTPGILLGGAINVDWEDIALDAADRLLIPDFGNNSNDRRDLVIYVLDEPRPGAGRTTWREKWFFRYPQQADFPAREGDFNYDAEALFTVGTTAYILTKHRSDTHTRLYRLDDPQPYRVNELELLGRFDIGGRVTAADASADGLRLLVATYQALWLFERATLEEPFFDGRVSRLHFKASQVEAACFVDASAEQVLLADEQDAVLFELALRDFNTVDASELAERRQKIR